MPTEIRALGHAGYPLFLGNYLKSRLLGKEQTWSEVHSRRRRNHIGQSRGFVIVHLLRWECIIITGHRVKARVFDVPPVVSAAL